jgi:hypothetical protein
LLSRNANAPGAGEDGGGDSRPNNAFRKRAGELGIFLIESRVTGAQAASIGGVNPPGRHGHLREHLDDPATADVTTSELDAVTFGAAGAQQIIVSRLQV